jgi:hypothetical protein
MINAFLQFLPSAKRAALCLVTCAIASDSVQLWFALADMFV